MENKYFKIGVIFAFLSVILGAFGAHLLKDLLSVTELSSFKTGGKIPNVSFIGNNNLIFKPR